MYTCTSMYLNTHTSFMQGHSSTQLPFTTTTSLTTHCAIFIELFLLEHLRCYFVTSDRQRVFLSGTPSMTVLHSGRRPHFACVHVDLRQQGFFSLAARLARDGRLWVDTTWMRELSELVVEDNLVLRIAACEGEHPDGSSVALEGSKGHPSTPVQLRLRPSTFAVAIDTTTGEPFNLFSSRK